MARDGWKLAHEDSRGVGREVVFLHGAACNAEHWSGVLDELSGSYRTVVVDLPGHGRSPGPRAGWSWSEALTALDDLVATLGLDRPAVVGHSLGGMLAAMWSTDRDCSAAINLDGHGTPAPEITALDPDLATGRIRDLTASGLAQLPGRLTAEETRALLDAVGEAAAPRIARSLTEDADEGFTFRPTRSLMVSILEAVEALSLRDIYLHANAPLLIVSAVAAPPVSPGMEWLAEAARRQRERIELELAEVALANPMVTRRTVDATHGLLVEAPRLTASVIRAFLEQHH